MMLGNVSGISDTLGYQLYKESVWEWRVGLHCWHESMCGAWCVYRRKRMTHSRKLLLFTLLITAALRSRLMSKCCFSQLLYVQGRGTWFWDSRGNGKWFVVQMGLIQSLFNSFLPVCPLLVQYHRGRWVVASLCSQHSCTAGHTKLDTDLYRKAKSWVWLCENCSQSCSAAVSPWCSAKAVAVPEENMLLALFTVEKEQCDEIGQMLKPVELT